MLIVLFWTRCYSCSSLFVSVLFGIIYIKVARGSIKIFSTLFMTYSGWRWQIDLVTETELGRLTERIKVWVFCCRFSYICEEGKNSIILDGSEDCLLFWNLPEFLCGSWQIQTIYLLKCLLVFYVWMIMFKLNLYNPIACVFWLWVHEFFQVDCAFNYVRNLKETNVAQSCPCLISFTFL